jgi:hypothetical protein
MYIHRGSGEKALQKLLEMRFEPEGMNSPGRKRGNLHSLTERKRHASDIDSSKRWADPSHRSRGAHCARISPLEPRQAKPDAALRRDPHGFAPWRELGRRGVLLRAPRGPRTVNPAAAGPGVSRSCDPGGGSSVIPVAFSSSIRWFGPPFPAPCSPTEIDGADSPSSRSSSNESPALRGNVAE